MKYILLLMMSFFFDFKSCNAQNATIFDSLEAKFESVWINPRMPCRWVMTPQKKGNGRLTFFEKDSTNIEFDYFETSSLPFYTIQQNNFETTEKYYQWILGQCEFLKNIVITKLEENQELGYFLFHIKEASQEYVRIITKKYNTLFTIKISVTESSKQEQIDKLKMLLELNLNAN